MSWSVKLVKKRKEHHKFPIFNSHYQIIGNDENDEQKGQKPIVLPGEEANRKGKLRKYGSYK